MPSHCVTTFSIVPYAYNSSSSTGSFRFTQFSGMRAPRRHFYTGGSFKFGSLQVQDCTFNLGYLWLFGTTSPSIVLQNNLLERVTCIFDGDHDLTLYNDHFRACELDVTKSGTHTWIIRDTMFQVCVPDLVTSSSQAL